MTYLYAVMMTAAAYGLRWYSEGAVLTPDGRIYLAAGMGERAPRPYVWRILLPRILRGSHTAWAATSAVSLIATGPLLCGYLGALGYHPRLQLVGVAALIGLPGIWRLGVRYPVLVDQTGLALAIATAWASVEGLWWLVVPLAVLTGLVRESAAIWAAVFAWSALPLYGLVLPVIMAIFVKPGAVPKDCGWLLDPIRQARRHHAGQWFDLTAMVLPWGVLSVTTGIALASGIVWPLVVAMVLAYGQMLVADDTTRLYQQAAPLVIASALPALDQLPAWALLPV